jgi:hypothetical protein
MGLLVVGSVVADGAGGSPLLLEITRLGVSLNFDDALKLETRLLQDVRFF